jgi:hypothetical protein
MANSPTVTDKGQRIITDEVAQMAFDYLNTESHAIGVARANTIRAEFKAKRVFARLFRQASGSVEARKMWATEQAEYEEAMEHYAVAVQNWENMQDSRNRAELIIEAWRTQEASGRQVRSIR